jgi:hypothetical protein
MGIPIAWARTTVEKIEEAGRSLIRVRMQSRSYKAYAYIYRVNDQTDVIIDPETALPVRIDLRINEGNRHKSHLTTFHHDQKVAIFQDRLTKDIREVPITETTQDVYSFVYANRNADFETMAGRTYRLYSDGKVYDLGIKILSEGPVDLDKYGSIDCVEVEPIADFDGMFVRQGKIQFWVSKENRRMVTCIKAKVPVGKVIAKLQQVTGPGDDFWVNHRK